MDLLYTPIRLTLANSAGRCLHNEVAWPAELVHCLESVSNAEIGAIRFQPMLLDAMALSIESLPAWHTAAPAGWVIPEDDWSFAVVLVMSGCAALRPFSTPSRQHWQASMSAWLADWFAAEGQTLQVQVGWPVVAQSVLIQLFKSEVLALLKGLQAPQVLRWEPGAVVLKDGSRLLAAPTRGLPRDTALYAVAQCFERRDALKENFPSAAAT